MKFDSLSAPFLLQLSLVLLASMGCTSLEAAVGDKIGTNQPVGDGAHLNVFSEEAKAIVLSNGNVLFYWVDQSAGGVDGNFGGVFCKVVAQDGSLVKGTFTPYDVGTGHQAGPFAAPLVGGGFAIAWENGTTDSVSTSLVDSLVRVFDNSGNAVSAAVRISDTATATVDVQHDLNSNNGVIPLPNGNFFVVLRRDERGTSPNHDDDLYQLFSATGVKIGTNQPVGDGAHLNVFSTEAQAVVLSNGNVLFFWVDHVEGGLDGDLGGVFYKVVAPDGTVVKGTFTPYDSGTGHQAEAYAAPLVGGGFAIAWENGTTASVTTSLVDSLVRVFDNSGNAASAAVRISDTPTATVDVQNDLNNLNGVLPLPNGSFFVVQRRDERGSLPNYDDDLFQLFSAAGAKIGTNQPVGDGPHLEVFSAEANAIVLSNGNVLFYWVAHPDTAVDGDLGGVFCKVVAPSGTVVRGTFTPYDVGTGHQAFPYAAPLAGGGFAIAWEDGTTDSVSTSLADARVRVFDNSGTALTPAVRISDTATATPEVQNDLNNLNGILPLPNGNFFAVLRRDERGTLPNYDDDLYQLFEGPVVAVADISVTENSANVPDGGTLSFGTTMVGTSVTKTFTVSNSGTGPLSLSNLTAPAGFTIAQNFGSSTVAAGGPPTTFQLTMNAVAVGNPSGMLSFDTNDPEKNPYNFTISGTVNEPPAPTVTGVSSSTANGTYKIGDVISIQVNFSAAVTVTGTPQLTLETGTVDRIVGYTSGSGTTSLAFSYTIQEGDLAADLDYTGTTSLSLNGGTIRDAFNTNAVLTLPAPGAAGSLGANKNLVIDGVRPTATIVVADNSLTAGETSLVTITFSEAVTGFTNAALTVENGMLSTVGSSDGGITWTATLTPALVVDATNVITLDNTGVTDHAGNAGVGTTDSNNYAISIVSVSITALDAVKSEGNGGGTTNFTFTVARTGDLSDAVTVDWTVAGSGLNPANAADFAATSGQVTLNATEASKILGVAVIADNIVEPSEAFTVTLSNPTNGYILTGATAGGTIVNDDSSILTLTGGTAHAEGNAGTTSYVFTATLSAAVQGGFSVAYATNDGTATVADDDYVDNDGSLAFAGTVAEQHSITVLVNGDTKVEADESFTVSLGALTGGPGGITVAGSPQTGTITNDDSASISITDVTQSESAGAMNFSVTLTAPADVPVTVDFATADGTAVAPGDYTASSGTVTFPANSNAEQTVSVTIVNDGDFEAEETFFVNLSNLGASGRNVTIADAQGIGTIQNDDTLTISITATDGSADENSGGTDRGVWRVSRNGTFGDVTANLEVDLTSTALAADWTQNVASFVSMAAGGAGTVTIPDGQSFVDIELTAVDDLAAEADETVQLNVTAGTGYTPSNGSTRTVTIVRNDFGVTNVNDSGEGTLRQAIENANVLGGNPTVTFEGPVFIDATADTITLTSGAVPMSVAMTIDGPGADLLTVNGSNADRVFFITGSSSKFIGGLTITGGHAIGSDNNGGGGAIFNLTGSSLTLNRCAITGNTADTFGGGILNFGTLDLLNSTVSGNTANGNQIGGGGIDNAGSMTIVNSTLSGNSAPNASEGGGGLINLSPALIVNSTITGNQAGSVAGGIASGNFTVTLRNTIVAGNTNNTAVPDVGGTGGFTSQGHNMIGNAGTVVGLTNGTNGDQVGTGATPVNPLLGALQNNGGSTQTHALLVGSPAIDAGDPAFDGSTFTPALTNDQRGAGFVRVTKGLAASSAARIDIGAYELIAVPVFTNDDLEINTGSMPLDLAAASGVSPAGGTFSGTGVSGGFFDPTGLGLGVYTVTYTVGGAGGTNSTDLTVTLVERPSLTVTSTGDAVDPFDGQTSLREALAHAASLTGPQTVDFSDNSDDGAVNFHDGIPDTIMLGGTELEVTGSVTLAGPGAELLTVSAGGSSRVFFVPAAGLTDEVILSGLSIADGDTLANGGGLMLSGASVTISECIIRDCRALSSGAGLYKTAGKLVMADCVVKDSFIDGLGSGAGAFHIEAGSSLILRTTISGNTGGNFGAGVVFAGDTEIRESLLEGNFAYFSTGGLGVFSSATVTVINSTISGNTAASGGGIGNSGTLAVIQSTITDNNSSSAGGGISNLGGTATISNSLIAGNSGSGAGPDLDGAFIDLGGNLVGVSEGATGFTVSSLVGTLAAAIDPLLAPLADHGGPTLIHALLVGSPAIDAGDDTLAVDADDAPLTNDQRGVGFGRIAKGFATSAAAAVDIGAYEIFAAPSFLKDLLTVKFGSTPFDLVAASGVTPGGGVFSGPGVGGSTFNPSGLIAGDYTVTYTVTDAYGVTNASILTVRITPLAPPSLVLSKVPRFKPTQVGKRSRPVVVRATNRGEEPVQVLSSKFGGMAAREFRLLKPNPRVIAPGGTAVVRIVFAPRMVGARRAVLRVRSAGGTRSAKVSGLGRPGGSPPMRFPVKPLPFK